MGRTKKLLSLVAACIMLLSIVAGCGQASDKQSDKSDAASTQVAQTSEVKIVEEDPFKDHVEFSFAVWDIGQSIIEGQKDPMYDEITKKLNITIKPVNVTWDDYASKLQIWAASSQLPDLFAVDFAGTPSFSKFIGDGLVKAIPEDLSKYPNIQKVLANKDNQVYKYTDDKFYCIPRVLVSSPEMLAGDKAIYVRKDWMQNVGITSDPESLDEFIALMKAFVEKDPDENGKNDTIGLTAYNMNALLNIMFSYEPGLGAGINKWIKEEGKWIPAMFSKNTVLGVKALSRMFKEGVLDQDIALIKGDEGRDKFISGKAGAFCYGGSPGYFDFAMRDVWNKANPDKKITDAVKLLHFWKAPDGNYYRHTGSSSWSENYINSKVDDKKMDRIMRFMDYFLTEEGLNYSRYGLEGVDYKKENGKIVLTPKLDENGEKIPLGKLYPWVIGLYCVSSWDGDNGYSNPVVDPEINKQCLEYLQWMQNNAKTVETDYRINFLEYPSKSKATANPADDITRAMLSDDPEKEWSDIIAKHMEAGYTQIIEEVNAEVAKLK